MVTTAAHSARTRATHVADGALSPSHSTNETLTSTCPTRPKLPFLTRHQTECAWRVRNALIVAPLAPCCRSLESFSAAVNDRVAATSGSHKALELRALRDLIAATAATCEHAPLDEALARLFAALEPTHERTRWHDAAIGCLVLVPGDVKHKVEAAIDFSRRTSDGEETENDRRVTAASVRVALRSLLRSVVAVFDLESVERTTTDERRVCASIDSVDVEETVRCLWAAQSVQESDRLSFETHVWPWLEAKSGRNEDAAWLQLLDMTQWPECGTGALAIESELAEEEEEEGEEAAAAALSFRFSSVEGGVLTIGEQQAVDLYDLLAQSAFTRVAPETMYDTFIQHTGDGLLEEESFLEAIEELLSMTDKQYLMEESPFLESMLAIFRSFLPESCFTVDAFEVAAGFSLMAWGSKSDKLVSAFHYFDADSKECLNRQQLWRFLRSVLITLLHLSPPAEAVLRYGSLAELVDKGEDEIMAAIMEGFYGEEEHDERGSSEDGQEKEGSSSVVNESAENSVDGPVGGSRERMSSETHHGLYAFEDFGLWYNGGGYKAMSWLELLDLRKWVFVSPLFALEGLDTRSVDPVVASNNYYTANNIQADVDGEVGVSKPYFTFADVIDEENDEGEALSAKKDVSAASAELSSTSVLSNNSSVPATLPAICLKNEVVLEFDLPFDTDNDAVTELPLMSLSYDNGDLIQFFELQRVLKLNRVQLYQVYDAFEPYMEEPHSTCIEKRTFDKCVEKLLPVDLAPSVAAAFVANSNARVLPRGVGRGKEVKMAADTLSRLFFAFNRSGTGKIDLVEFVAAFTIFCAGSKSEKLAFAYRLFDADGDGCLTRREMWKYLRSFLTMLLALGNGSELSAEAIASVADTTAIEIADCIFKDTDKTLSTRRSILTMQNDGQRHSLDVPTPADSASNRIQLRHRGQGRYEHRGSFPGDTNLHLVGAASRTSGAGAGSAFIRGGVVSFEEFAVWYSKHGYTIIAWIELLDTKKWPEVPRSVSDAILRYISRQQHALENATRMGSEGTGSGSSNDTVSSNESSNRIHESLVPNIPDSNMTLLDTSAFRTTDRYAVEAGMDAVSGIANLITSPTASTTAAKDLSSVALQFKMTSFDNTTLRIRLKDVAIVYTISERMNLSRMACGELVHLLKKHAQNRSLTKLGYLRAMRHLVPRDELSDEDQEFLSFHLLRIFTLFERESVLQGSGSAGDGNTGERENQSGAFANGVGTSTKSVEIVHLVAGMCVFCGTTKSAKLSVLFKLFASHGIGHVSRRRLFEMLKSILVVLFAFSSYDAARGSSNYAGSARSCSDNSVAERAAGVVISKLFSEATCKRPDIISLAEFAAWYAAGGYMDCPWLELLDLSKWPAKEAFEASKREKPLLCAFDMLEEGSILHFTESDISTYLFMLRSTKLSELNVSKVYDALLAYATPSAEEALKMSKAVGTQSRRGQMYSYAAVEEDEGAYLVLTRANFYECVRSLVSKENMSEKAQQTSSKLLSRLFNVFDRKRCGRVNALELACGLSILGRGSKSQKLSLAFDFITKMRQQRHKTLASYAPAPYSASVGLGGFGVQSGATGGLGFGIESAHGSQFSMNIGSSGFPSTRDFTSAAQKKTRGGTTRQPPPPSIAEVNALPHSVLFIYLRSFLLALMALSDGTYRLGLEKIYVEADDFIEEAMGDLMTDVSSNGGTDGTVATGPSAYGSARSRARVTFEQFGEWYNTGGYQLISWVELLDGSKWQQQQDFQDPLMGSSAAGLASVYHSNRVAPLMGSRNRGPISTAASMVVEPLQPLHHSVKPATRRRQVRQSDIVSTPFVRGLPTPGPGPKLSSRESASATSLCSDGPVMVFAVAKDAAELQFFSEEISTLKLFLRQTQLHTATSWELRGAILKALGSPATNSGGKMLTRRSVFLRTLQTVCGRLHVTKPSSGLEDQVELLDDEAMEMLHSLLGVFVHEPAADDADGDIASDGVDDDEPEGFMDMGAAICGLLVVCKGSMFEKLQCCALLMNDGDGANAGKGGNEDGKVDCQMVKLKTIKSSLTCFLMAFYGISSSLSAEIARDSADLGADAVLQSFVESLPDDATSNFDRAVSLRAFSDWFSASGYPSHSWLELAELNHWPAAINVCGSNGLPDDLS